MYCPRGQNGRCVLKHYFPLRSVKMDLHETNTTGKPIYRYSFRKKNARQIRSTWYSLLLIWNDIAFALVRVWTHRGAALTLALTLVLEYIVTLENRSQTHSQASTQASKLQSCRCRLVCSRLNMSKNFKDAWPSTVICDYFSGFEYHSSFSVIQKVGSVSILVRLQMELEMVTSWIHVDANLHLT